MGRKQMPPSDIKMRRMGDMSGGRQAANLLFFFAAVTLLFSVVTLLTNTKTVSVNDGSQLSGFDFSSEVAYISADCFNWYPDSLYTPDDFAAGVTQESQPSEDSPAQYGTYRLVLNGLTPGTVYGISGYSATYAQTLWVDGVELSSVGTPGERVETTIPKTNYYTVYFTAGSVQTEIVIQRSNFVHANGGQLSPLYLGEQSRITSMVAGASMRSNIVVGCMLMAALFFFGIFLFFKNRRHFLWFALSCLLITIRTLFVDQKLIMVLFPDLNWHLSLKLEYLTTISFLFFFFSYVNRMFDWKIHRAVNIYGLVVAGVYFIVVLVTPSTVYTRFLPCMQYGILLYVLAGIFLLTRSMVKDRESRRLEHILILLGSAAYMMLAFSDIIRHGLGGFYDDVNMTQIGMMVFVFANTLALALNFTRTETELEKARVSEREMEETNQMLERLSRVRTDFLANITHEMRTPLAVMSSLAELTQWQLREDAVTGETDENLSDISKEAIRLAELADLVVEYK